MLKNKLLVLIMLAFIAILSGKLLTESKNSVVIRKAYAEINSHEDEDRGDEDSEDSEDSEDYEDDNYTPPATETSTQETTKPTTQDVVTYETITITPTPTVTNEWVYDAGYDVDTDGDGLVDAIDPEPNVAQPLFFTDSDSDGVADAYDKHPGENDFTYTEDTDANNNGIIDSMEQI